MGYPMHYHNTEEIWDEMRSLCPKFTGATYESWTPITESNGPVSRKTQMIREHSTSIKALTLRQPTEKAISITSRGHR